MIIVNVTPVKRLAAAVRKKTKVHILIAFGICFDQQEQKGASNENERNFSDCVASLRQPPRPRTDGRTDGERNCEYADYRIPRNLSYCAMRNIIYANLHYHFLST